MVWDGQTLLLMTGRPSKSGHLVGAYQKERQGKIPKGFFAAYASHILHPTIINIAFLIQLFMTLSQNRMYMAVWQIMWYMHDLSFHLFLKLITRKQEL